MSLKDRAGMFSAVCMAFAENLMLEEDSAVLPDAWLPK